jgi:hypothetical protein
MSDVFVSNASHLMGGYHHIVDTLLEQLKKITKWVVPYEQWNYKNYKPVTEHYADPSGHTV